MKYKTIKAEKRTSKSGLTKGAFGEGTHRDSWLAQQQQKRIDEERNKRNLVRKGEK